MENLKGLEEYLNKGCYIRVIRDQSDIHGRILTKVLKKYNKSTKTEMVIAFSKTYNILSGLSAISLVKAEKGAPLHKKLQTEMQERILIDELLKAKNADYSVHFYKLSNNQYLSTICVKPPTGEYIPLQSIITDTILSGIRILNEALNRIKRESRLQPFIEYPYYGFQVNFWKENAPYIEAVEESIKGHQKTIGEKK